MKNFLLSFIIVFFVGTLYAQVPGTVKQKAPIKFDSIEYENLGSVRYYDTPNTAANYVAVDTAHNTFSAANCQINPLVYDPVTDVATVVHRGNGRTYAQGSGELWWNYSTDRGVTWSRSLTSVQNNVTSQILARYPSMATFNPSGIPNITNLWGVFSWAELQASYGYLGYGVTIELQYSAYAQLDFDPPNYGRTVPIFSDNSYIYWVTDNQDYYGLRLFRTVDYSFVQKIDPPTWNSGRFGDIRELGGVAFNNSVYVGLTAAFTENIGVSGWEVGYSKSTDHGATWTDWYVVDWKQIPVTAEYDELWDWLKGDTLVSYAGDIQVDKNGFVHIICGLTDTITATEYGYNAVVEFFEISTGIWDAKILAEGSQVHDNSIYHAPDYSGSSGTGDDPGTGQCGPSFMIATNIDRDFFAAQWTVGSPETADTLCDIYIQTRSLDDPDWSPMVNLTETNSMNEDGAHLAPYLAEINDGNSIESYAFSMFWYEAGNTGAFTVPVNPSVIYIAPVLVRDEILPVELSSFSAKVSGSSIIIKWITATELNNLRFEIERKMSDKWDKIGFKEGNGTTSESSSYEFIDDLGESNFEGIIYYRLKQVDYDGSFEYSEVINVNFNYMPFNYSLSQNYPNPFNPNTIIEYSIQNSGFVTLKIFDVLGKEVTTLVNRELEAGNYEIDFNASDLPSGIYYYSLTSGNFKETKKMILLK